MNSQIVTVNLTPGLSTPAVVRVSQYDVGRPLTIRVLDGTGAASFGSSVTATIVGTKPSGLGFTQSGLITGNTVTLNTTLAMTQECGMIPAEIRFTQTGENIGTANFILVVEPSPHPDGTTDGTQETMADLETRLQAEIDDLSDRIDDIEAGGSGLSSTEKQLILTLFSKAAYAEDDASTAYDALESLWASTTRTITYNLSHVTSSNSTASIESGQSYITTLTASADYTLNTVTVTMGGVDITSTAYSSGTVSIPSVTGDIVITATAVAAVSSISAVYTQSSTIYSNDSLDDILTAGTLVVTATYTDSTTGIIPNADCTLSGSLTTGTSTITVSYGGKTATFNINVTSYKERMSYSMTSGLLTKINGSIGRNETYGMQLSTANGVTENRRAFVFGVGETPMMLTSDDVNYEPSIYYPVPVPASATSVTFTVTPNTQYISPALYTYDSSTQKYTRIDSIPWTANGTYTESFTAGSIQYVTLAAKRNSSGTAYTTATEPTEATIVFS